MSALSDRATVLRSLLLASGCALLLAACTERPPAASLDVGEALGGVAAEGFARADAPRQFRFPEDHAAHPDFRNEWWYFTGHLEGEQGQRFGYQLTLFRIALAPGAPRSESAWATHQVWMGHAALTDMDAGQHRHTERYARGAAGLAGQAMAPFRVWLEDWQISGAPDGSFPWRLRVESADFALDLDVSPQRTPVLQGDRGLSQKSAAAGNASYYYSITRLATRGEIRSGDRRYNVQGLSWLDREWSTSALGDDQAGWDWFSLQLDSGADLMLYRLRRKDGSTDPNSAGKWVTADTQDETLGPEDFHLRETRFWTSPETGRRYPVAWTLESGGRTPPLEVEAVLDAQEMRTAVTYWEGAVWVRNAASGERIGRGYLEMTGY
jgi:predicted secreted hydrolase